MDLIARILCVWQMLDLIKGAGVSNGKNELRRLVFVCEIDSNKRNEGIRLMTRGKFMCILLFCRPTSSKIKDF